jgi:cobalt-zinc-cadmium efflux system outer membrane protein
MCFILLGWFGPAGADSYGELKERSEKDQLVEKYMEQISSQEEMVATYPQAEELEKIGQKLKQWKKDWEKIIQAAPEEIFLFNLQSPILKEKRRLAQSKEILNILKQKVDLELLITATLERNPAIAAAKKEWQAALEKFSQADRLEHLMLQYESFVRDLKLGTSAMPKGRNEFPFPSLTSLKGDIALKEVEIAREKYLLRVRDTLTQTETAFYQRVFLVRAIEILEEDIKLLKDLESSALTRYNTGKTGYSNVIKINTMLEKSETDLKNEIEGEQTVAAKVNYLLNLPEDFPLGDFIEPKVNQRTVQVEQLYQTGLENRQELVILQRTIEKINLAILMAEKKIYPDYSLGYSSYEHVVYAKPEMKMKERPAQMPQYWFGTNDAYTREARMNYQAMQKKLESEKRELLYRLKDEVKKLNISLRDLKLYRDSLLKLAQDDLEVSLKDYQGGRVGFLDVLEAEKQLLKYRLAFQEAIRDHHQSQARIRQLIGRDF